jgi:hypothetical protein
VRSVLRPETDPLHEPGTNDPDWPTARTPLRAGKAAI